LQKPAISFRRNIKENNTSSQISRWSTENNNPPQFITLKLHRVSIVKGIKFGKYEKAHVCNIKKFRIYAGIDPGSLMQVFEGGLRNDSVPETFELRHKTHDNLLIPSLYLKIVPLLR